MASNHIDRFVLDRAPLDDLARAYAENKTGRGLIFFVGSGPSTEAGLPSWKDLLAKLSQHADYLVKRNAISDEIKGNELKRLKETRDYWQSFSLLKSILGKSTYSDRLREHLTPKPNATIPGAYSLIAGFDIRGIITTNVDDLLAKAMASAEGIGLLKPVYGLDIRDRLEILLRERPFFFQIHGTLQAEKTWVFTKEELDTVRQSTAHNRFLTSLFFTNTVVFIGISAEDVAVSGRLVELVEQGLSTTPHYWITPDIHNRQRDWAERNGIRQIVYPSKEGHDTCLREILRYVKSYRSIEPIIEEVKIDIRGADIIERDPARLASLENLDKIRTSLNGIILENRDPSGKIDFKKYGELCSKYRRAIASAFLLPETDDETWFGHHIDRSPLGGRTFGSVYSARSSAGEPAAVKILQQKRYQDAAYLSAFRRGAEALRILEKYSIAGVARLREAYELPPTLIMEFERGATLDQIIPSCKLAPDIILKVFLRCAGIIKAGHSLPQTVMHRDIKPSNIMLRDFDWGTQEYDDVVVFDFDLAWYKGADGDEVSRTNPESLGFQAPELLQSGSDGNRRSTLVDSFGLATTLYFCFSRVAPLVGGTEGDEWKRRVDGSCARAFSGDTVAARRAARLILACTNRDQRKRPDSSLILDALDDLVNWRSNIRDLCSTEFIAEAIMALATEGNYEWEERRQFAFHTFPSGMSIRCCFNPIENLLVIDYNSEDTTDVNRKNANQRLAELPEFLGDQAEVLEAIDHRNHFLGARQVEGYMKWDTSIARAKVELIGGLARKIGLWLSAL